MMPERQSLLGNNLVNFLAWELICMQQQKYHVGVVFSMLSVLMLYNEDHRRVSQHSAISSFE